MTNKEAIKYLQQLYPNGGHCWLDEQRIEALGMAIDALQEEPVNEDLEEEITKCYKSRNDLMMTRKQFGELIHRFTGWQKKQMLSEMPVSEGLEDASKEWLRPKLDKSYANYGETKMMELTHFDGYNMLDAIEFGAEWQKNKNNTIVSKDLKQTADNALESITDQYDIISVGSCLEMFRLGSEWSKKHLWKDAQGDDLPEIDREVIVLCENSYAAYGHSPYVAFGHRPNPDGWDGKSLATGEVKHYTPKTYDKGGWNFPDVKYWLDVELPKEIEV